MGPQEKRIAGETVDLRYFEWGKRSDPTILLLHATSFHARCWDRVIGALPGGLRVIAPDLPGHGQSGWHGGLADWRAAAAEVTTLVRRLGLRDVVGVGHSFGSHCMMQAAADAPEHFSRVVLVEPVALKPERYLPDARAGFPDLSDHPIARRRNVWASPDEMYQAFKDKIPYSLWDADVLRDYCAHGLRPASHGTHLELACAPPVEVAIYSGAPQNNPYDLARQIALPVTVVRGGEAVRSGGLDFLNSTTWQGFADSFADGSEIHLPDMTHLMPMQEPARIAGIIANAMPARAASPATR